MKGWRVCKGHNITYHADACPQCQREALESARATIRALKIQVKVLNASLAAAREAARSAQREVDMLRSADTIRWKPRVK